MIKLSSGISRELKGHFVLDENGLRRIAGVLSEKAQDLPYQCSIVFHVKREDDRFYETTQVEDVLADANTPGSRIKLLRIELRNADPNKVAVPWERDWIVAVQYSNDAKNQSINVTSEDKNWALILADAIEPQVTRTFTAKQIPTWILIPTYVALAYLLHTLTKSPLKIAPDTVSLIDFAIWIGAFVLSTSTLDERNAWISKWAGPKSSFQWGEQALSYNQFESNRQNIFWVVFVGFAVSIMATFFMNTLLPQTSEPSSSAVSSPIKAPNVAPRPH